MFVDVFASFASQRLEIAQQEGFPCTENEVLAAGDVPGTRRALKLAEAPQVTSL